MIQIILGFLLATGSCDLIGYNRLGNNIRTHVMYRPNIQLSPRAKRIKMALKLGWKPVRKMPMFSIENFLKFYFSRNWCFCNILAKFEYFLPIFDRFSAYLKRMYAEKDGDIDWLREAIKLANQRRPEKSANQKRGNSFNRRNRYVKNMTGKYF